MTSFYEPYDSTWNCSKNPRRTSEAYARGRRALTRYTTRTNDSLSVTLRGVSTARSQKSAEHRPENQRRFARHRNAGCIVRGVYTGVGKRLYNIATRVVHISFLPSLHLCHRHRHQSSLSSSLSRPCDRVIQ